MRTTLRKLIEEHPDWADLPIATEGKEWYRCQEMANGLILNMNPSYSKLNLREGNHSL